MQDEYRLQTAMCLLETGLHLIPSDVLRDNQLIVSRALYDAMKRVLATKEEEHE
jgi:hypothetical protein